MFEFHFDSCSFVKYAAFGRFDTILHVRDLILKIFLIVGVCILHLEWFSKLFFNQKHDTHVTTNSMWISDGYFNVGDVRIKNDVDTIWLHRCWWRMLETKCIRDTYKMLMTVLTILVTKIHYLFT